MNNTRKLFHCLIMATVMLVAGCGITTPFQTAETPNQKAAALRMTWNVLLEDAAQILEDPTIPNSAAKPVNDVRLAGTRIADAMSDALVDYELEKARLDAGLTTADKLDIAAANLERWYDQLQGLYIDLAEAVASARGETASIIELEGGGMMVAYSPG